MSKNLVDPEEVNAAGLYHFGESRFISYIARDGIKCELAKEGGSFGKGVYFCCDSLSDRLRPGANVIVLARVLLGKCATAHKHHTTLPYLDEEKKILADSTKAPNDEIWVIYNNDQIYPGYFIELEDGL